MVEVKRFLLKAQGGAWHRGLLCEGASKKTYHIIPFLVTPVFLGF